MVKKFFRLLKNNRIIFLLIPYLFYVGFIILGDRGPVDYETFMNIGRNFLEGGEIYGQNSYYPMPFVMIFALFSWLPKSISMAIWFSAPVILALCVTGGSPMTLLYAPLFGHFVGGQSSFFGLLGLWGYRKYQEENRSIGGVFLALLLIKPQLGIFPVIYAMTKWRQAFRKNRRIPPQAWAFMISFLCIYLPGFFVYPDWLFRWLSNPRPQFVRAMSGLVPRSLMVIFSPKEGWFWLVLIAIALLLLLSIWLINNRAISFDLLVLWSYICSPLVHDYDLIQLIPLLHNTTLRWLAALLSIPGWIVILFAYTNDSAWYAFVIIAPGLLAYILYSKVKKQRIAQEVQ